MDTVSARRRSVSLLSMNLKVGRVTPCAPFPHANTPGAHGVRALPPLGSRVQCAIFGGILSVSNNVAEGFERFTTSELLSFLDISRGSGGEVRSMMAVIPPITYHLSPFRR